MSMPQSPTVPELRHRLEERRRRTLGLVKAIDRVGIPPSQLDARRMRAFAEADAEIAVRLGDLARLRSRAPPPPGWTDPVEVEQQLDHLEAAIFDGLPPRPRAALREAHQVGILVVEDEEIYEGLPRPRRR